MNLCKEIGIYLYYVVVKLLVTREVVVRCCNKYCNI